MRLFVGLGNPGAKHSGNRHNIGYMAADRIAADHDFSPWRTKFQGRVAEGRLGSTKALLLKPETFMNLSGQSVGEAARFFRIPAGDVTVLHDELDLAPGKCRFKRGGGHAGHNGLRSIHAHIGPDYCRIRLGIGRPVRKEQVLRFVLGDFAGADREWLEDLLRGVSEGAPKLAAGDPERFMNAVSLRVAPPRSSAASEPRKNSEPSTDAIGPEQGRKPERERKEEPERFRSAMRRLAERFR